MKFISDNLRYIALTILCVGISLWGIWAGVRNSDTLEGQRGGAFAVALSFAALFIGRSYGRKAYNLVYEQRKQINDLIELVDIHNDLQSFEKSKQLERRIHALDVANKVNNTNQHVQNICLATSAVFSTLVWGFGDIAVQRMIDFHRVTPSVAVQAQKAEASNTVSDHQLSTAPLHCDRTQTSTQGQKMPEAAAVCSRTGLVKGAVTGALRGHPPPKG